MPPLETKREEGASRRPTIKKQQKKKKNDGFCFGFLLLLYQEPARSCCRASPICFSSACVGMRVAGVWRAGEGGEGNAQQQSPHRPAPPREVRCAPAAAARNAPLLRRFQDSALCSRATSLL